MQPKQYIDVERVKGIMKSKGIDTKTMAQRMECSEQTVKRLLSGVDQRHMSGDTVYKVANALQVSIEAIFHADCF